MGICGCGSENSFFVVKDTELVMEKFEDCSDCGGQYIQISILKEKDKNINKVVNRYIRIKFKRRLRKLIGIRLG